MKRRTKELTKGITLIALVVTIVVLLILAGTSIAMLTGENGIITQVKSAKEKTYKEQLKEELQMIINDLQMEKKIAGEQLQKKDIVDKLKEEAIIIDYTEDLIEGEYKDYNFTVDEKNEVIIGNELRGEKPEGVAEILTTEEGVEEVEIRVIGSISEGTITSIEALNGAELKTSESDTSKIFKVTSNGNFKFEILGSNGRRARVSCEVTNVMLAEVDILTAIAKMTNGGKKKIKVVGSENTEIYSFNVIHHEGDMVLDGTTNVEGAMLTNKIYEFGNATEDPANASRYAQNTVVLKVEGNLTINSGVTLTSVKNAQGYGGPKGMIVYCTGTLTNNGTISMTERGAKAVGQNVYLFKNKNNTFEYIPSTGAGTTSPLGSGRRDGSSGLSGTNRQTGGGGSGSVVGGGTVVGMGSQGTSYSGGCGGAAAYKSTTNAELYGGKGGCASDPLQYGLLGGGAGNPGGTCFTNSKDGGSAKDGSNRHAEDFL